MKHENVANRNSVRDRLPCSVVVLVVGMDVGGKDAILRGEQHAVDQMGNNR